VNTNPLLGLFKTIFLLLTFQVNFHDEKNKSVVMEDGVRFRIFRHVELRAPNSSAPQAVFVVRFRPRNMTVEQNIRFSLLPLMIFMGFHGFREKFWCVNDETGLCQGVYAWQTREDAENYCKSIAMRFMTHRSYPESVSFKILDQSREKYWMFDTTRREIA